MSSCMPGGRRGTLSKATLATRPSSVQSSAVACWVSALHAHCDMSTATTLPAQCESCNAYETRSHPECQAVPLHVQNNSGSLVHLLDYIGGGVASVGQ